MKQAALLQERIEVTEAPPAKPYVELTNCSRTYASADGPITALAGVTLNIAEGEFVSIVGPSGCGKSTLLRCIAGLDKVTGGEIRVAGDLVRKPPDSLGVVFQRDLLLDWRTVLDNVLLTVEFAGGSKRAYRAAALELLRLYGLAGYENRYPWQLSGGMRQRAAICRALIDEPHFLLMDEPFGALDALTRDELNVELQDRWLADCKTVLFITHSISEAVFLSDRVIVMDRNPGRIVEDIRIDLPRPRPLSVREQPAFGAYAGRIRDLLTRTGAVKL